MAETSAGAPTVSSPAWSRAVRGWLIGRREGALIAAAAPVSIVMGSLAGLLPTRVYWLLVTAAALTVLSLRWPVVGVTAALALIPSVAWIRRITAGPTGYVESDPLVLLPVLAVGVALLFVPLDRRLLRTRSIPLVALAAAAFASGLVGMGVSAAAGAYGLVAQLVPISLALVLASGRCPSVWTAASRTLLVAGPIVAVYGIHQRFSPTSYDLAWLLDRQRVINSIGEPEVGAFRIFGTMESPGPFAFFLALSLLAWLALSSDRFSNGRTLAAALSMAPVGIIAVSLAVTAVRTALVAVPVSLILWAFLRPGRDLLSRLVAMGLLTAAALILPIILGPSAGSGDYAANRFDPTSISSDTSFQDRALLLGRFSEALTSPLGDGIGTTGTSTSLATGDVTTVDNGYLARALETGALGLLLFLWVAVRGLRSARRVAVRDRGWERDARLLVIVAFLWFDVSGPATSTAVGLFFWVAIGSALAHWRSADSSVAGLRLRE